MVGQLPVASPLLALAVVAASDAPMLLLDGNMAIVAASDSFCTAFGIDPGAIVGTLIYDLDNHAWNAPRLRSLLNATVSGIAAVERYELTLALSQLGERRLVFKATKLDYGDESEPRLLLAVLDVTDARLSAEATEALLRDKALLASEVQHRVANSLQIIASILMQSARRVQSEEARGHLTDAHQRIVSLGTLQRQLIGSGRGEIDLGPYLDQLCESLGASMIYDHRQLSLATNIDKQLVAAEVSVSIGLVVTELVINALKHAFPDQRDGHVIVDYVVRGLDWTLSVTDDGVGMGVDGEEPVAGLGTSIVQSLARQLHADITVTDMAPGTRVSLNHGRKNEARDAANDSGDSVAV